MAMDRFGLQFTEDAVLGLFGLYDDDRGGSLGYYEFVDNILANEKAPSTAAVSAKVAQRITNKGALSPQLFAATLMLCWSSFA
jgi:hypothetical protein